MVKIAEELKRYRNNEIEAEDLYDSLRWGCKEIKETLVSQSRWCSLYEWVVKDEEDRLWKFSRSLGSTECQDNDDFDGDIVEVEPYEKVVIDYRPIGEKYMIY